MKVFVTGTDGYIGAVLAVRLLKSGHEVTGFDTGYYRAGWVIRPRRPWRTTALAAWLEALTVERKKGLFLTERGWLAVNQARWETTSAPADGRARLELIDPAPLDAKTLDRDLKRLPSD